jgi:uncharacterized protein (DUF1697 family)
MKKYVALLRAVNLGPHNKIAMSDLRELCLALGCSEPRTLLQSGNVVFGSASSSAAALERKLEAEAARRLKLETEFFVRSAAEWAALIAANPFASEAKSDPSHLLALVLKSAPDRARVAALQAAIKGREVVKAQGTTLYAVYPDGIGRSRLTNALIERHLGTPSTGRNWNTVLKLAALAGA